MLETSSHVPNSGLDLSIVVPAYNEAASIGASLERIRSWAGEAGRRIEILVVDDGSKDNTSDAVADFARRAKSTRVLRQNVNRGKGAAVRRGMLEARASLVLFCDADLSAPIEEVDRLIPFIEQGYEVVIGSRSLPGSDIRRRQPLFRETMGRTFNKIVRAATNLTFIDTQCGFKLFTHKAAQDIFRELTIERFAFDVEALLIAQDLGYKIREVPIVWAHADNSRVSPLIDSARMFRDVVRVRLARATR